MKPAPFDLFRPRSVDRVLALLQAHGDDAKVLAGGQSLVPLMNFRLAQPRHLIDLNGVPGMDQIQFNDHTLSLGAMVRQRDVERSPAIAERLPILREAIEQVGHPAIRNRGTVGGSIVHADPSAELPLLSIALDATVHLRSAKANRSVAARDFYQGYLLTDIAPDELLVGIDFRLPPADCGWCCSEIARRHGDFAIVAVAALADGADGIRLGVAGMAERPAVRRVPSEGAGLQDAIERLAWELEGYEDIHASAHMRRDLLRRIAPLVVREAMQCAA